MPAADWGKERGARSSQAREGADEGREGGGLGGRRTWNALMARFRDSDDVRASLVPWRDETRSASAVGRQGLNGTGWTV